MIGAQPGRTQGELPWLIAPIPVLGAGVLAAARAGIGPFAFATSMAAVILGIAVFFAFARAAHETRRRIVDAGLYVVPVVVAATLAFEGMEGVRRWITVGPVRLNASAALTPWFLAAVDARIARSRAAVYAAIAAMLLLHVAQPDAGQATAVAVGAAVLVAGERGHGRWRRWLLVIGMAAAVAVAWGRPDPLPALDHVERILVLGVRSGLLQATSTCGAWLALIVLTRRGASALGEDRRLLALSFAGYFAATFAVAFVGRFPVPIMGASAAPILGWYMMAALLHVRGRG